jgi:hypothetical protein
MPESESDLTNRERENRLSVLRGAEERSLVIRAIDEYQQRHFARRSILRAVLLERARCAKIADQWPDNLLAREIARQIRKGPK